MQEKRKHELCIENKYTIESIFTPHRERCTTYLLFVEMTGTCLNIQKLQLIISIKIYIFRYRYRYRYT